MKRSTFFLLCLEGAVLSFNVAATAALVPAIAADLAVEPFIVGRIIWFYMLPYGVAALLYGPLVRAFDAKKVELICLFLFSLSNILAGVAASINMLFLARFFMGVFGASVIPLGLILISKHVKDLERGKSVGIFFGATFIASLLGLFLSGIINWRLIYLIPGYLGLGLCLFIWLYLPSFKQVGEKFRLNYLDTFKNKRVCAIFGYIFLVSVLYHGVQQWLGVYFARELGLNQFLISMLITLTSLSGVFGEIAGGKLSDKAGRVKTVNIGIALMILSVFLLLVRLPVGFLAIIMVIWGLGWTFNHAALSTMLTDLPHRYLHEAASLNSGVRFISGGIGTAISGVLMAKSFNLGFLVLGVSLVLLTLSAKKLLLVK
ncbi:MAG: MFS transporter [Candidatus Omnitrophota bacterium]